MGAWLGYELNWIRQRHQLLERPEVVRFEQTMPDGCFVVMPASEPLTHAPGLLWLFGETGIVELSWGIDESRFDAAQSMESYEEVQIAKALFPEAKFVEVYPLPEDRK